MLPGLLTFGRFSLDYVASRQVQVPSYHLIREKFPNPRLGRLIIRIYMLVFFSFKAKDVKNG